MQETLLQQNLKELKDGKMSKVYCTKKISFYVTKSEEDEEEDD